jgi:hypothetical protein
VTDAHWIRVTTTESVPRREGRAVSLGGRELAIFNLGDRFLAIENRCPHRIRFVEERAGYAEYVCEDCGHPFCFVAGVQAGVARRRGSARGRRASHVQADPVN